MTLFHAFAFAAILLACCAQSVAFALGCVLAALLLLALGSRFPAPREDDQPWGDDAFPARQ